jgi:O-antigen/teichoic acid export membrane protein
MAGPWAGQVGVVAVNQAALFLCLGLFAVVTSRALGPANRGVLVIFVTLSSLIMLVGSLGTNTAARVRMVAAENRLLLADYLGLAAGLLALQAVASVGLGAVVLSATHSLPGGYVLVAFAVYSVLNLACMFLRDGLYAFGHNAPASRADAVAAGAQLATVLVAFTIWHGRLVFALVAILVGSVAELGYLARRYAANSLSLRPRIRFSAWPADIRSGLPALVVHLGQAMTIRFDRILLGILASTGQVGIYSVAATMSETLWLIPTSIAQVVFHRVASAQTPVYRLRRIRIVNLALSVLGAGVLAVLAPSLVRLLFGEAYQGATAAMRVLLIAAVAVASYQLDITCVIASNGLRLASGITCAGFGAVLLLDLVLIPRSGPLGAAWASVVGYGLMAALSAVTVARLAAAGRRADPARARVAAHR